MIGPNKSKLTRKLKNKTSKFIRESKIILEKEADFIKLEMEGKILNSLKKIMILGNIKIHYLQKQEKEIEIVAIKCGDEVR